MIVKAVKASLLTPRTRLYAFNWRGEGRAAVLNGAMLDGEKLNSLRRTERTQVERDDLILVVLGES